MDIHQCPRCELRFVHTSELRDHFQVDHAGDPRVLERYRYGTRAPGEPPRTVLLVGNQTLGSEAVLDEVVQRAAGARLVVVVPATPRSQQVGSRPGDPTGAALAQWRLQRTVDRLVAAGLDAEGEVGDADPFVAVRAALARRPVDEILVSTLPPSTSRWLGADLPGRLRRQAGCPVTVLTPAPTPTG